MKKYTFCVIIVALLIIVVIGFVSCGGSGGSKLTMIAVTPGFSISATGTASNVQYTATETLGDNSGTFNTTQIVNWSSSNTGLATIQSQVGLAIVNNVFPHSMSPQMTLITADDTVNSLKSSSMLVVSDPVSTMVTPIAPYMAVSTSYQFSAIATFPSPYNVYTQDLTPWTGVLTWSISSDPAHTGTTVSSTGLVTAGGATGTVTVQAQYLFNDGTNPPHTCPAGNTTLTVTATPLQTLVIDQANPQNLSKTAIPPTLQFTATGTDQDTSNHNYTTSVTWSSSDSTIATISSSGLATAVAQGSTIITATDPITGIASGGVTLNIGP
jgi:Bacterial Ig-like domain (group 2)